MGHWSAMSVAEVLAATVGSGGFRRAALVAVDGRSSAGKTTLATRICEATDRAAVVHTDDVAWHYSVFGWDELLLHGVLLPVRRGEAVSYRPPAWEGRGRLGAIEVPADAKLLIVEGVGAGRRELATCFDGIIWVQSDLNATLARDQERIAAGEIDVDTYKDWMRQERPFQADQETWTRAQLIVCGSTRPDQPGERVLAAGPPTRTRSTAQRQL